MLGTLLDAREDSVIAFVSGVASLLLGGARERARENARIGAGRLVADGFCLAAVLWSVVQELQYLTEHYELVPLWSVILLAGVPVFALLGRDRLAGLCGMTVAGYVLARNYDMTPSGLEPVLLGHPGLVFFLDRWLGPLVCFTIMVLKPRTRAHDPRRLIWLTPAAVLLFAPATPVVLASVALVLYLLFPLAGIVLLPIDPRLAIASAVFWADTVAASTLGHIRLGLITIPVVLLAVLVTIGRGKAISRRSLA
jgi:hypothetical protein